MDAVAHIAADNLVPACGGAEKPFTVSGRQWLYCYHPASGRHCYLDLDNDRPFILSLSSLMKLSCFDQLSESLTMKSWRIFTFNPRGRSS